MRYIFLGLLLLAFTNAARCQVDADRQLNELNTAIEASPRYDAEKLSTIDALKRPPYR